MKTGKLSENVYKRCVLKEINNGAGTGTDCAILSSGGETGTVMTMVSVTVHTKDAGKLAVYRAVNQIASSGAEPAAVMAGILLPAKTEEKELRDIVRQIKKTCSELHVRIAGIDVTVLPFPEGNIHTGTRGEGAGCSGAEAGLYPILMMTGIGSIKHAGEGKPSAAQEQREYGYRPSAAPGQDIVVTKWIGLEGTYLLAKEKKRTLCERFSEQYIEGAEILEQYFSVLPEADIAMKSGISVMRSISEGGIFAALWEMAESAGVGLEIELKKIPIRQETVELCNYFDLNPYAMFSGGSLLIVADEGERVVQDLQKGGILATVIGKTTNSNDRLILNEEEKRFLTPPQPDELYKIL